MILMNRVVANLSVNSLLLERIITASLSTIPMKFGGMTAQCCYSGYSRSTMDKTTELSTIGTGTIVCSVVAFHCA